MAPNFCAAPTKICPGSAIPAQPASETIPIVLPDFRSCTNASTRAASTW